MRPPHLSIAGLMAFILILGVGMAALRDASDPWARTFVALTLGLLALAVLGAIVRRGPRRAFWTAFASLGGGYLALCLLPWSATRVEPILPTSTLLARLHPLISPPREQHLVLSRARFDESFSAWAAANPSAQNPRLVLDDPGQDPSSATLSWVTPNVEPFRRIGHCLLALIFAVLGGILTQSYAGGKEAASTR